ncbi:hypothetical protein NLJ89_g10922 [Agrocybe chaxingu]|uniref:Uncharacterized protein n=1 Tax=Agrocybe chaxingu TaxID=84603 RepID=A0A9W8JPP2_9AGAR|nr:hypothetical protein NLJ89_g10922 [Agrocybe chaxingu]
MTPASLGVLIFTTLAISSGSRSIGHWYSIHPIFLVCGTYAFWNYAFPPAPRSPGSRHTRDLSYQLVPVGTPSRAKFGAQPTQTPKLNERRSRVAFALIVLFTFLMMSLAGSVISSAILGFVAAGLYKSANFNMSTWIPFLLAMLQAAIGLLSVWPSIIEII